MQYQITHGLRVASPRYSGGTCTGRTSDKDFPEGELRAEVEWDNGITRWPLVRILSPHACPICGADLKREGFPTRHQHADTGALCDFDLNTD